MTRVKAPFPYYGSKSRVVDEVWRRFGSPARFIEPFAGSLAVYLGCPNPASAEIVNDRSGLIANFWRAVKNDPDAVAAAADHMSCQTDIIAWRKFLASVADDLTTRMESDVNYYDSRLAGRTAWVWSCSFNGARNDRSRPNTSYQGTQNKQRDMGVVCKEIAARLRDTIVFCSDWTTCVTGGVTKITTMSNRRPVAIFFDPPYSHSVRTRDAYHCESPTVASDVARWCAQNGDDSRVRIALCGYVNEGHAEILHDWTEYQWSSPTGKTREYERIWFSPSCLP